MKWHSNILRLALLLLAFLAMPVQAFEGAEDGSIQATQTMHVENLLQRLPGERHDLAECEQEPEGDEALISDSSVPPHRLGRSLRGAPSCVGPQSSPGLSTPPPQSM